MDQDILSQINEYGNIDPSWLFGSISIIAVFLIWNQIREIKESVKQITNDMKKIIDIVNLHEREIAVINEKIKRNVEVEKK